MGSSSAFEALHDDALYKYRFTLLYRCFDQLAIVQKRNICNKLGVGK